MTQRGNDHVYVYGLDVTGLSAPPAPPAPPGTPRPTPRSRPARLLTWHQAALRHDRAPVPSITTFEVGGERAVLAAASVATVTVEREPLTITVAAPEPVPDEVVVHPLLAFAGAAAARWHRRSALHGAAVLVGESAWVLLAAPGGGKSTLASELSRRGHPVLSDDLSVIDGHTVLAGPRACDLRSDAAGELKRGVPLAETVGRPRWREELPAAPLEAPLGGFVLLEWGDRVAARPALSGGKLAALASCEALAAGPTEPTSFLDLLGLPCVRLTRPRSWDALAPTLALIEELASG